MSNHSMVDGTSLSDCVPYVCVVRQFGGLEYEVEFIFEDAQYLSIELHLLSTKEEWNARLSPKYIEELTRKTGNFKRFQTFVSMLHAAVVQISDSLHLDVLSFDDLEFLHRTKLEPDSIVSQHSTSNKKRYLILTYITDFDKVHYPLPLNYVGSASYDRLRTVIKELRNKFYNSDFASIQTTSWRQKETEYRMEISTRETENKRLRDELSLLRKQLETRVNSPVKASGDVKMISADVRCLVNGLENELFEEKSKAARQISVYRRQIAELRTELNSSKTSQRTLHRRLEKLTSELDALKRKQFVTKSKPIRLRSTSSGFDSKLTSRTRPLQTRLVDRGRPSRRDWAPLGRFCDTHTGARFPRSPIRACSASPTIIRSEPLLGVSPNRRSSLLFSSQYHSPYSIRSRTASVDRPLFASKTSIRRFDPTAYVRQREQQRAEIDLQRRVERYRQLSGLTGHPTRSMASLDRSTGSRRLCTAPSPNFGGSKRYRFPHLSNSLSPALNSSHESLVLHRKLPGENHSQFSCIENNTNSASQKIRLSSVNRPQHGASITYGSDEESFRPAFIHNGRRSESTRGTRLPTSLCVSPKVDPLQSDCESTCSRINASRLPRLEGTSSLNKPGTADADTDLDDIDRRLNVLQDFFKKYLGPS